VKRGQHGEPPEQGPTREELAAALAANAAAKPFNIAVLVGSFAAALAVGGSVVVALLVALVVYAAAAARTMFDGEEADRVAAKRARAAAPATPAPPIARRLGEARAAAARTREAIERAELPLTEVSDELDGLVSLMEESARRAQLLYEAPPPATEDDPRRQVELQLSRFYDELARVVIELDMVVSASASTDTADQQRLAADVRVLRDELAAVAPGMTEADERETPPRRR
jgi:hypothetical protein